MTILIVEGADFSGKTTTCKKYISEQNSKTLYLHFPIRDLNRDVICNFETNFKRCDDFAGITDLRVIQDIILANINDNCAEILRLNDMQVFIAIDRFILSNIVYRAIHVGQILPWSSIREMKAHQVFNVAKLLILVEPLEELLKRKGIRNDSYEEKSLDSINEADKMIGLANEYFAKLRAEIIINE